MGIKGSQLLKFTENSLSKFGIGPKLHRNKILLEIARNDKSNEHEDIFCNNVDILNWSTVKVQEWCSKTQVISIYAHKFFSHGIDGMLLFELDAKDLHTIGVKKIHQQRVLDIIAKFAKASFLSSNEEEKDPETENKSNMNGQSKSESSRTRGSVAHVMSHYWVYLQMRMTLFYRIRIMMPLFIQWANCYWSLVKCLKLEQCRI